MNKIIKTALLAASGLAIVSAAQAATYPNGDLIVGFTVGSGSDVVVDLGQASSLSNGQNWNLSSFLAGFDLTTVKWGVIGSITGSPRIGYSTTDGFDAASVPNNTTWGKMNASAAGIYLSFNTAGAGNSASILVGDDNSWNNQTIAGSLANAYHNSYEDPNVTGLTSAEFWSAPVAGAASQLGNFSLDNTGTLTFNAVPEPSTYALLAGGSLLMMTFRYRSFRSKKA